jgi:hypothetical protein
MNAMLFRAGPHKWIGPMAVIGLILPLCFAAPSRLSGWMLADAAGRVEDARDDASALNAVRNGFMEARLAERDFLLEPGEHHVRAHEEAVAGIRRDLGPLRQDAGEPVAGTLSRSLDVYVAAFARVVALKRQAGMTPQRGALDTASVHVMEATLGQLNTGDEAELREPLLGMRQAGVDFLVSGDPRYGRLLSGWADMFSARLSEVALPEGTRASLRTKLAAYQNEILGMMDLELAAQRDMGKSRDAALGVVAAMDSGDLALSLESQRRADVLETARVRFNELIGGAAAVSVLLAGAAGFGMGRAGRHPGIPVDDILVTNLTRIVARSAAEREAMTADMVGLVETARLVESAMGTVDAISAQARTWALIARLEAEQAGDAGIGFATVAEGMEGLADWTERTAGEMGQELALTRPGGVQPAVSKRAIAG